MKTIQGKRTPQETFGELIAVCIEEGNPKAYRGDLYHDAMWLSKNFESAKKSSGFFWSLREHGTALDIESARNVDSGGTDETIYFVELP